VCKCDVYLLVFPRRSWILILILNFNLLPAFAMLLPIARCLLNLSWIWNFVCVFLFRLAWCVIGESCDEGDTCDEGDSDVALLTGSAFASKIFGWICTRTLYGGVEDKCLEGFVFCHFPTFYSLCLLSPMNPGTSSINRFNVYSLWCIILHTHSILCMHARCSIFFSFLIYTNLRLTKFVNCLRKFSIYIKLSVCSDFPPNTLNLLKLLALWGKLEDME